ncbi:amidohydrolase [Clostridium sp. CF012]|uniref:amidohydrolase n=1 Tax=Clostridium sp. CF012 TaxID=2843319 RepID=UPI001C0BF6DD|nr:amidohydrolase [Clostridium sp. CF012]MBU3145139.1 amidohydrolase [Clostridium sp. CF012]
MDISLILINGKIHTLDGKIFESMAVAKDRIVKLGLTSVIKSMATSVTHKIDLKGKSLFPGFNDSHLHLQIRGADKDSVNLSDSRSLQDIIEKGKQFIIFTNKNSGEWLHGYGWNQNNFDVKSFPTRDDLDKISTVHPIVFSRTCHHIGVMNSIAIKLTNINNDTAIKGGSFDKDKNGIINGIFREGAVDFVYNQIPKATISQIKNNISIAMEEALRFGVTSLQTSDLHNGIKFEEMYEAYMSLKDQGRLKARISQQLFLPDKTKLLSFLDKGFKPNAGDNYFRLGPVKLLTDGSLGARTAALIEDYSDDPGNKGVLTYFQTELDEMVDIAHQNGFQITLHAIGDAAVKSSVEAIEKAFALKAINYRHRINHCQIGNIELFERMAKCGLVADIQPVFVSSDWSMVEGRVGKSRVQTSYAWKSMTKAGIRLAGGTDSPVESLNPMYGIYAAVTRKGLDGNPSSGWLPDEKLSVQEALELYTKGSAYATYEENEKGTLTEGKLADMVVLSENPLEVPRDNIKDIEVLTTIVGGNIVYSKI